MKLRVLAGALLAVSVYGVDGVVLIDQNRALAGNVTPGDTAGYPITLSQPGSYRLSSNLTVPFNLTAIEVTTPFVIIDLNGFTISGPIAPLSSAPVLNSNSHEGIGLRNGVIRNFAFANLGDGPLIVNPGYGLTIEDLFIKGQSRNILTVLRNSRVMRLIAPDTTVKLSCPSVMAFSLARGVDLAELVGASCSVTTFALSP